MTIQQIILKQGAPKIDTVPDKICPKINDLSSMFWQIFVCSAKSAKDNNKWTAQNYSISWKKSAVPLVCLLCAEITDKYIMHWKVAKIFLLHFLHSQTIEGQTECNFDKGR